MPVRRFSVSWLGLLPALAGCHSPPIAMTCVGRPGDAGVPEYVEIDLERRTVYDGRATWVDGANDGEDAQIDIRFDEHSVTWQSTRYSIAWQSEPAVAAWLGVAELPPRWRTVLDRDSGWMVLQLPDGGESRGMCRVTARRWRSI